MRLNKLKLFILTSLILTIISIYPSTILAQTVAVTGTITDTQTTPYSNGLLTVTFVNSTGQQATFGGNPSFQKSYAIYLDANGAFTISLPPNSTASPSIQPAGTQWNFSYQSQGGYGAANINVTITGAGSISGTLSNLARITWPYGNIPPPGAAGQGIVFVSSTTLGWGTTGTAGAVTHTAGNLTALHLMLGNGLADSTVDSACVTNGTGALSGCTSITTPGTVAANALTSTTSMSVGSGASAAGATATGGFAAVEAASTGWTPTVGQDYCRADSTVHNYVCAPNGVAELPMMLGTFGSCGTANALALYTAPTTLGCGNADFTYASHTLTGGAAAIVNLLSQGSGTFIPPSGNCTNNGVHGYIDAHQAGSSELCMNPTGTPLSIAAASNSSVGTSTTCTNQVFTVISSIAVPTCTSLTNAFLPTTITAKDPLSINNFNQAAQSQVVVSATEYYITRSDLDMPAAYTTAIAAGTTMKWRVSLNKTAAGTGTFQVLLKKGTNGSTADTSIVTQTIGTQTAAADNMEMDVQLTWTSATAAYWAITPRQSAASGTGFGLVYPAVAAQFNGTISGQTTTTASDKYGLSVIFTTGTPTFLVTEVQAQAFGVN